MFSSILCHTYIVEQLSTVFVVWFWMSIWNNVNNSCRGDSSTINVGAKPRLPSTFSQCLGPNSPLNPDRKAWSFHNFVVDLQAIIRDVYKLNVTRCLSEMCLYWTREREREREREFICQVSINIYNVHQITYNGRLPERHTPIYAGHLWPKTIITVNYQRAKPALNCQKLHQMLVTKKSQ